MKQLVCVVCPNSCRLTINLKTMEVSGNLCPKGVDFARAEVTCPKRTLCTTVRTVFAELPMLPVRTDGEIDKNLLFDAMAVLATVTVEKLLKRGEVVVENICGTGVDVVSSEDMQQVLEEARYE